MNISPFSPFFCEMLQMLLINFSKFFNFLFLMDESKFLIFWRFGRNFLLVASGCDSPENKLSLTYSKALLCSSFAFLVPCRIKRFRNSATLSSSGSINPAASPALWYLWLSEIKVILTQYLFSYENMSSDFINSGSNIHEVIFLICYLVP